MPFSLCNQKRLGSLWDIIIETDKNGVTGDFVECGAYKGGSSMLACYAFKSLEKYPVISIYDTCSGMPKPGEHDFKENHNSTANDYLKKWQDKKRDGYVDWCYCSKEDLEKNLTTTKYEDKPNMRNWYLYYGDIREEQTLGEKICVYILLWRTGFVRCPY